VRSVAIRKGSDAVEIHPKGRLRSAFPKSPHNIINLSILDFSQEGDGHMELLEGLEAATNSCAGQQGARTLGERANRIVYLNRDKKAHGSNYDCNHTTTCPALAFHGRLMKSRPPSE
jgi:hypothetical protein